MTEPGTWHGNGTKGRHATYRGRNGGPGNVKAFLGYWWYVGLDGSPPEKLHYCEHAHQTHEAAARCGEREAKKMNRVLERIGGGQVGG